MKSCHYGAGRETFIANGAHLAPNTHAPEKCYCNCLLKSGNATGAHKKQIVIAKRKATKIATAAERASSTKTPEASAATRAKKAAAIFLYANSHQNKEDLSWLKFIVLILRTFKRDVVRSQNV